MGNPTKNKKKMDSDDSSSNPSSVPDNSLFEFLTTIELTSSDFNEALFTKRLSELYSESSSPNLISKLPQKSIIFFTNKLMKMVPETKDLENSILLASFLTDILRIHGNTVLNSGKSVKGMRKFHSTCGKEVEQYDSLIRKLDGKIEFFTGVSKSQVVSTRKINYNSIHYEMISAKNEAEHMDSESSSDDDENSSDSENESESHESELEESENESSEEMLDMATD